MCSREREQSCEMSHMLLLVCVVLPHFNHLKGKKRGDDYDYTFIQMESRISLYPSITRSSFSYEWDRVE